MARAISSLPTPLSPSISTGMLEAAARRPSAMTRCMASAAQHEVGKGQRALGLLLEARDLALQRLDLERAPDRDLQALGRGRLDDEVDRAGAHGADGGVDRSVRGLHDHGRAGGERRDPAQHLDAVHARHDEVEQHERDGPLGAFDDLQGLLAALGGLGVVAQTLDQLFEDATLGGIVIDDQDELGHWQGDSNSTELQLKTRARHRAAAMRADC